MIKKIKAFFQAKKEYKEAVKALTLLIMNQYSSLLEKEAAAKEAEQNAYASLQTFGEAFQPEDLQKLMNDVSKIAGEV